MRVPLDKSKDETVKNADSHLKRGQDSPIIGPDLENGRGATYTSLESFGDTPTTPLNLPYPSTPESCPE